MLFRYLIIVGLFISAGIKSMTVTSVVSGDWENSSTWSNHQVPTNPDSIIIKHYVTLNQNTTIGSPTVLFVDSTGTICGDYLLETLCGASFINYGHMYLNQIKTRAGLNYNTIECKNAISISGCSGGYFNSIPPKGNVTVWPAVLCKTIDTNWEGGTSIGLMELENSILKIYPNPIISNEPLTVITLSNTTIKITDAMGKELENRDFENKTELFLDNLPAGMYFLELEINGKKQVKKILKSY